MTAERALDPQTARVLADLEDPGVARIADMTRTRRALISMRSSRNGASIPSPRSADPKISRFRARTVGISRSGSTAPPSRQDPAACR